MLRDVWAEMELDGVAPRRRTFDILMDACTKDHAVGETLFYFKQMRRRALPPTVCCPQ